MSGVLRSLATGFQVRAVAGAAAVAGGSVRAAAGGSATRAAVGGAWAAAAAPTHAVANAAVRRYHFKAGGIGKWPLGALRPLGGAARKWCVCVCVCVVCHSLAR